MIRPSGLPFSLTARQLPKGSERVKKRRNNGRQGRRTIVCQHAKKSFDNTCLYSQSGLSPSVHILQPGEDYKPAEDACKCLACKKQARSGREVAPVYIGQGKGGRILWGFIYQPRNKKDDRVIRGGETICSTRT